jgi:hypothetical protein
MALRTGRYGTDEKFAIETHALGGSSEGLVILGDGSVEDSERGLSEHGADAC